MPDDSKRQSPAALRWLKRSRIPGPMNSSRPSSQISRRRRGEGRAAVQEALRQHLAGAKKPGDVVQTSLANLKEVSAILNAKAPQDAAGFKAWLQTMSKNVAEASSEGGFLGIGGVQVSDAEKATLADISRALGTSA
jgi:membrane-bound lytic murein transglycosylase B